MLVTRSTPIPAVLGSARLNAFLDRFDLEPVRPAKGMTSVVYAEQGQTIEVPVLDASPYAPAQCWFNCLEYAIAHGGSIVFGWGLWTIDEDEVVAQHHAVWRSPGGTYLDVTPSGVKNTTFLIDGRSPYDYVGLRTPFGFRTIGARQLWTGSEGQASKVFVIGRGEVPDVERQRLQRIVVQAVAAGLLAGAPGVATSHPARTEESARGSQGETLMRSWKFDLSDLSVANVGNPDWRVPLAEIGTARDLLFWIFMAKKRGYCIDDLLDELAEVAKTYFDTDETNTGIVLNDVVYELFPIRGKDVDWVSEITGDYAT
jgi:hypothetical protein